MTDVSVPIDLWLWSLDCSTEEASRRAALLSASERDRADRFVHARDRIHFISGRSRMREILSEHVGGTPAELLLEEGRHKKPILAGGPVFNLSHTDGLAALVVTMDRSVWLGVDIEGARPVEAGLDAFAFAPEERAALTALDVTDRDRAFFLGWTRKEAVIKATGEGLYSDLESFAVTLDPADTPRVLRIDGQDPQDWRLHDFRPRPDLAGAIAAMTGGREIKVKLRS